MILLLEGVVLGLFLVLACAFAIKDGAVGAVQLGLTTHEKIKKRAAASSCPRSIIF